MVCELEIAAINSDVLFQPLGETPLRGKTDIMAAADPNALKLARDYPRGVPAQRIIFDAEKATATIDDPLEGDGWRNERELLAKRGQKPHPRQELTGIDPVEWAFWLVRSVEAGLLKIVEGKLPKSPKRPDSLTKRERAAGTESEVAELRQRVQSQDERIDRLVCALEKLAGAKPGGQ